MKELERISDYITQLENERAELNKQIDALKSDIADLGYRVRNNYDHCIRGIGYKTELIESLATNMQDTVDGLQNKYDALSSTVDDVINDIQNNNLHCPDNLNITDEYKIRSLYKAVGEAIAKSKAADNNLTTPNDEVTVLRSFIKRLGTVVDWKYVDQEEPWTDSQINELTAIVQGNHLSRKNLDAMVDEIYAITREIQNDNFGLYHTLSGTHISLNTYNFESTHALAETIQKLADSFIRSCEHLEVAIGNLKVAQLCDLNKEIDDCRDSAHKWRVKSGALRWLDRKH